MRRVLRQPLVQFLLLGTILGLVWSRLSGPLTTGAGERIVVDEAQVGRLVERFRRTWRRPPTDDELRGLVEDFVKEEIYYREALAMGLDRDDDVIRRRLRQKVELLSDDLSQSVAPSEAELQEFLDQHAEDYRFEPTVSFVHVYLSPDRRGDGAIADAERILAELQTQGPEAVALELGDPLPLPEGFRDAWQREVAAVFGPDFAAEVTTLEPGAWRGPLRSGYGLHLVFVEERVEGREPSLEEVRAAVTRDFLFQRRQQADDALFERLRERYEVSVSDPP